MGPGRRPGYDDPPDGEPDGAFVGGRIESSGTDSDTVFKFATQYKFDDDRMVYLLYSEGFRLGGNNAARAAATGLVPVGVQAGQARELRGRA